MNRESRLRKVSPGASDELVDALASMAAADVDLIVRFGRQASRDGVEQHKAKRRQRVADRRRYHHVEDDQQADATDRQTLAMARRAGSNLETLARLQAHYDDEPTVIGLAVAGLRAQYSDTEIGVALGHPREFARQAVHQKYGRRNRSGGCSAETYSETSESGRAS